MTPERLARVKAVFEAALQEPPERLSTFLADACAGDASLQAEALALLSSHRAAGSFIEHPPGFASPGPSASLPPVEEHRRAAAGRSIAGYRVLRPIGEGGMGIVYEAEQEHPRREVGQSLVTPYEKWQKPQLAASWRARLPE